MLLLVNLIADEEGGGGRRGRRMLKESGPWFELLCDTILSLASGPETQDEERREEQQAADGSDHMSSVSTTRGGSRGGGRVGGSGDSMTSLALLERVLLEVCAQNLSAVFQENGEGTAMETVVVLAR